MDTNGPNPGYSGDREESISSVNLKSASYDNNQSSHPYFHSISGSDATASAPQQETARINPSDKTDQSQGESDRPFAPGYGPLTPAYTNQDSRSSSASTSTSAANNYTTQGSYSAQSDYGNPNESSSRPRPSYNRQTSDSSILSPPPETLSRGNRSNRRSPSRHDNLNSKATASNSAYEERNKSRADGDQHSHFFVNTEHPDESYQYQEADENTPYPIAVTFIDRKTGIEYSATGEPIHYPDTLPICNNMEDKDNDPTGQSYPPESQVPTSSQYNRYNHDYTNPAFSNPKGATSHYNAPPPSYPQVMGENSPYMSSGYYPGFPSPYPGPTQVNHGWAPAQSTQVSVINQPVPTSMVIVDPDSVPNFVPLSIIVTFFCCLCAGLYALGQAREANRLKEAGLTVEAKRSAGCALTANLIGIVLGIIFTAVFLGLKFGANQF